MTDFTLFCFSDDDDELDRDEEEVVGSLFFKSEVTDGVRFRLAEEAGSGWACLSFCLLSELSVW